MQRLRFRRHQHLKSRRDFERAFKTGSRARSAILLVVVVENGLAHEAWRRQQEKLAARERTASAEAPIADAPAPQTPAAERGAR